MHTPIYIYRRAKKHKNMNIKHCVLMAIATLIVWGCSDKPKATATASENKEAKRMLQGIWINDESSDVVFQVKGDSIYYPDSTSVPAYFKIVGDTLVLGAQQIHYPVTKMTQNLFWFRNQNGDEVRLARSGEPSDSLAFGKKVAFLQPKKVIKSDTVVNYGSERYHCYIAINPTTKKVYVTNYDDDGVGMDNIYYDNIVHISVYHGGDKLYSSDIKKQMFSRYVSKEFLSHAILSNMTFNKIDEKGFHFDATICNPNGTSCYLLDTKIDFHGKMTMELIEF